MRLDEQARHIYEAIKDDAAELGRARSRRKELAIDCMDKNQLMELTSFTVNGQSGAGNPSMTKGELLKLLNLILRHQDNDATLSTRTVRPTF